MKNTHMELRRSRWKSAQRSRRSSKDGIVIYHLYGSPEPKFSWWDDFGFMINGVFYAVWWVHPRMRYADTAGDLAHVEAAQYRPEEGNDWFKSSKKNYKRVGNSRKKVVSYEMLPRAKDNSWNIWYEKLREIEDRILLENDISIVESVKVEWLNYGKGIEICIDTELVDEAAIISLALKMKWLISRGKDIKTLFKGTPYTKKDWIAEGHKDALIVHSVA